MTVTAEPRLNVAARESLGRAVDHLLSLQHPDGWWKGELETNVTIDAEDIFLRHYLRLPDVAETTRRSAVWIRSKQRPDGSWATFFGGPADLSTTVEAYVALRIAGDPPEAAHMRRAAAFVRDAGCAERSRVFTRMWLSLLSLWSWNDVPMLPPEQILLPVSAPLSIYAFGCWARQTIVALQIVTALQPSTTVEFEIPELLTHSPAPPHILDRTLRLYERRPLGALRR
jgi:squalene-hopene/tetraprenyl-beta-curcumene cyclase